jgi:hypothetical protein
MPSIDDTETVLYGIVRGYLDFELHLPALQRQL